MFESGICYSRPEQRRGRSIPGPAFLLHVRSENEPSTTLRSRIRLVTPPYTSSAGGRRILFFFCPIHDPTRSVYFLYVVDAIDRVRVFSIPHPARRWTPATTGIPVGEPTFQPVVLLLMHTGSLWHGIVTGLSDSSGSSPLQPSS